MSGATSLFLTLVRNIGGGDRVAGIMPNAQDADVPLILVNIEDVMLVSVSP